MNGFGTKTDETLREMVQHGNDRYPFKYYLEDIWDFDFHRIDWHWHREMEMVYVKKGAAICRVGTDQMEIPEGGGLFINSGILHRFEAQGSAIIPNIVFSPALLASENSLLYEKYIRPVVDCATAFKVFRADVPWESEALRLLREVFALQAASDVRELATVRHLMELWQTLYEHLDLSETARDSQGPDLRQARLRIMMQFIHDNYARELTLEDIASSASVGKSSALNIFQSCIHLSPVAYLIQYRLSQAARFLCSTRETVTAIAGKVGFSNPGYFCRKFRQSYRMTPSEYRIKRS
ncbi:MAG: AraC family transcriptional regulator [Clostridia bacterium]|nr:AraC family transcriptional regulator [Clostridia bacterium]